MDPADDYILTIHKFHIEELEAELKTALAHKQNGVRFFDSIARMVDHNHSYEDTYAFIKALEAARDTTPAEVKSEG